MFSHAGYMEQGSIGSEYTWPFQMEMRTRLFSQKTLTVEFSIPKCSRVKSMNIFKAVNGNHLK